MLAKLTVNSSVVATTPGLASPPASIPPVIDPFPPPLARAVDMSLTSVHVVPFQNSLLVLKEGGLLSPPANILKSAVPEKAPYPLPRFNSVVSVHADPFQVSVFEAFPFPPANIPFVDVPVPFLS